MSALDARCPCGHGAHHHISVQQMELMRDRFWCHAIQPTMHSAMAGEKWCSCQMDRASVLALDQIS